VIVASVAALGATRCIAHDLISKDFLDREKAIADAQTAREAVLAQGKVPPEAKEAAQAYVATAYVWEKPNLSVCFWQTDRPDLLQAIAKQAGSWSQGTNVRFVFGNAGFLKCENERSADIRVTLKALPVDFYAKNVRGLMASDWSEYGNLASNAAAKVSMSLINVPKEFLSQATKDFNFTVAHEFGHALGLIHEHQRIDCAKYLADKATVMAAYAFKSDTEYQTFLWNLKQIPPSDSALKPRNMAPFDANSIMLYNFPLKIWKTLESNPCARSVRVDHPDQEDLAAVNGLYRLPPEAPPVARESARKVLESSYNDLLYDAYEADNAALAQAHEPELPPGAKIAGVGAEIFRMNALEDRQAAESIRKLLDAVERARKAD
jgi:hypothetical protein